MILSILLSCQNNEIIELPKAEQLPEVPTEIEDRDIILVLLRGLRADMSTNTAATDVFIQALGQKPQTHYTSAYTQSTSDFVSMSTILTGMYPSAIPMCGLIRAGSSHISLADQPWCARIPKDRYTLPTVLSIYGYRTHLITLDTYWHSLVTEGFQTHDAIQNKDLRTVTALAENWWQAASDRPRFLTLVTDSRLIKDSVRTDETQSHEVYLDNARKIGQSLKSLFSLVSNDRPVSIYFTSLNGVNLMERDGFDDEPVPDGESDVLLERTLHVPLLVYKDGTSGEDNREDRIVENLDIFPSIVEEIKGKSPANIQGEPLTNTAADPVAYAEFGDMFALRRQEHLLVFRGFMHDHTSLDPDLTTRLKDYRPPLFTLSKVEVDPLQKQNLRDSEYSKFQQLYKEMKDFREGPAAPPVSTFTPKQLWDLRMTPAQGYW